MEMEREQGWKNTRDQGAEGENVKRAGRKDPPNRALLPNTLHSHPFYQTLF